jgi:hypothetical protein
MNPETESNRFTVGVFQDGPAAEKGIEALNRQGFPAEALSVVGKATPELASLIEQKLGLPVQRLQLPGLGDVVGCGALVRTIEREMKQTGLGAALKHLGFLPHDGQTYEMLTARGGVLIGIRSEIRAADALATLHCYGGGNAAIGAWTGRL